MLFSSRSLRPALLLATAFFFASAHAADDSKAIRPKRGTIELGKGARALTDPAQVNQLNGLFSKVVESVSPSVVSITTEKKWSAQQMQPFDNRLYEFFGIPQPQMPDDKAPKRNIPLGGGSGFIASKAGHILTNAHVHYPHPAQLHRRSLRAVDGR